MECQYYTGAVNKVNFGAKSVSEQVADLEKQLAEAKAKLAAEEKAKAQTYGQKVAEAFVCILGDGKTFNFKGDHYVRAYASVRDEDCALGRARIALAAALDKAYADGAADLRKKCDEAIQIYADCKNCGSWNGSEISKWLKGKLK